MIDLAPGNIHRVPMSLFYRKERGHGLGFGLMLGLSKTDLFKLTERAYRVCRKLTVFVFLLW